MQTNLILRSRAARPFSYALLPLMENNQPIEQFLFRQMAGGVSHYGIQAALNTS